MDNNTTISKLTEMVVELRETNIELFDYIRELIVKNRNNRRDVAKLKQQLDDLRKELADLKKVSQD